MNSKIGIAATIIVIALAAFVLFYPQVFQDENQAGFFTLYFADCGDGDCSPSEDYESCSQDCCSTVCNNFCESSFCFEIDPDCDILGNATGECCGNGVCEGTDDCITCPADCPGSVVCSVDGDCPDDGNSLTVETCSNPGACDSSCSSVPCVVECSVDGDCPDDGNSLTVEICSDGDTCAAACSLTVEICSDGDTCAAACSSVPCVVECSVDGDCPDDANVMTVDTCTNPATCAANCVYTPIGCSIACSSNTDCDDSNPLTVNTCSSPGTCDSACEFPLCDIECSVDTDCDDLNSFTSDTCSNPATCSADCSYSACTPACFSSTDCDDGLSNTVDTCNGAGTCDANCSSEVCTPSCFSDLDCDDGNPATFGMCIHPGACGAHCVDDFCTIECNSNVECNDSDSLTTDTCSDPGTCESACSNTSCTIACSSNSDCDDSNPLTADVCDNPGTCAASCSHPQEDFLLSFEFPSSFDEGFERGNVVDLNVFIEDNEGNPVNEASFTLTDSEGNEVELEGIGGGNYVGKYTIPINFPVGEHTFSFFAVKVDDSGSEKFGYEEIVRDVNTGKIIAVLLEPSVAKAIPGKKTEIKFKVVYGNNDSVEDANVSAEINGVQIPLTYSNNVFSGHYLFSDSDLEEASLVISANDSAGNSGTTTIPFSVEQPFSLSAILAVLALIVAAVITVYGLKRTHRLSKLLHKIERIKGATRAAKLQHSIAKEKGQRKKLAKKIIQQEKDLVKAKQEVEVERRKQAFAVKRMPIESKYAAHGASVGIISKVKKIFSKTSKKTKGQKQVEKAKGQSQTEKRVGEIDTEVSGLKEKMKNLEAEFFKQTIKEDFFRKKLFDYREKMHLLELEKKKIE